MTNYQQITDDTVGDMLTDFDRRCITLINFRVQNPGADKLWKTLKQSFRQATRKEVERELAQKYQ